MGNLVEEVKIWNTPVIGAFLLWKFTQGYCKNHPSGDAPIGLLHFIALSILTNERLSKHITNRRKDLQSYIRSFEENKDSDILLSIQTRIKAKRKYIFEALDIAVADGLIVWDTDTGKIYAKEIAKIPSKSNKPNEAQLGEGKKAEILGMWFSQHNLSTIASYLKVVF